MSSSRVAPNSNQARILVTVSIADLIHELVVVCIGGWSVSLIHYLLMVEEGSNGTGANFRAPKARDSAE